LSALGLKLSSTEAVEKSILFIERGADVNGLGDNALHLACHRGRPDLVEILLEAGCDVNSVDEKDETPLMQACDNGMFGEEIIPILIEAGADISLKKDKWTTAVRCAFYKGGKMLRALAPFVPEGCKELKDTLPVDEGADLLGAFCEGRKFGWEPEERMGDFVNWIHDADTADYCWALLRDETFDVNIVFTELEKLDNLEKYRMVVTELCSRNAGYNPASGRTLLHAVVLNSKLAKKDRLDALRFVMTFYINPFVLDNDGNQAIKYCDTKEEIVLLSQYQRWRPDRRVMEWYGPYCKKRLMAFLLVEKRLRLGLNRDLKNLILSYIAETECLWVK
jgi:hypothetical protein